MAFSSASRGNKPLESDKTVRDANSQGRTAFRTRGDNDADRLRDGRSTNPLRRRGESEDAEGWNTVKPRKSFGAEGAERFHGKMGGNFRDERRPTRDNTSNVANNNNTSNANNKDDRDNTRERPGRAFDGFAREKDAADAEARQSRNGLNRNKGDNWRTAESTEAPLPEKPDRERNRDRTKSWRDRDRDRDAEPSDDRGAGRTNDRRWGRDRDQRNEREPEWLDEPVEGREAHTQQDFQKWMEQMKKAKSGSSSSTKPAAESPAEAAKPSLPSAPVAAGPDKFFMAFGGTSASTDVSSPGEQRDSASAAAKSGGKSSRFTSFFSQPQGDSRPRTEASTPLTGQPVNGPGSAAGSAPAPPHGLAALLASAPGPGSTHAGAPPEEERQAFQTLLAKLQKQSVSATPPGPSPFAPPPQQRHPSDTKNSMGSPEPFQQYGGGHRDGPLGRPPSQQPHQEILAPRPQPQSARPDQLLQDLVGHHQRVSSQGSNPRPEPNAARNNSNTEFLMNLMRMAPEAQRPDQGRVPSQPQPQLQKHSSMPPFNDREEYPGRENRNNERVMRPQPPPGFPMDESFHNLERDSRQNQPTQILQRPPPPGLDQMPPNWMGGGGQMPPPQQRGPMLPPPGLAGGPGGPNRNMPMPPMFPPNFPPGAMPPPPEAMGGMPPRNMPPPPPGFFNGPPPHGFLPPGLGGFNGPPPGPDGFGGPPFEARGMPPPSAGGNGRGGNYGRP